MQAPVQLRLNVLLRASLLVHGLWPSLVAVPHRSFEFGLVPPAVPPSHVAHPSEQPTDIHRHVCPMLHGEEPLLQAQACPCSAPSTGCQMSGDERPPAHRTSLLSMALRGFGEMRLEWADAEASSANEAQQVLMGKVWHAHTAYEYEYSCTARYSTVY